MIVEVETLSATIVLVEAVTVDAVAEAAPMVKVTVVVLAKATPSVVSVAEIVLVSALVDFIMAVVCPLAPVGEVG